MRGLNKAQIIGNLGQEPDLRYTGEDTVVCNLRVATNETWTNGDGNQQQKTEWHTVVCWEKLAEAVNEHLSKGSRIYVEGSMETREWTDRDGNNRQTTQIKAQDVIFLGGRSSGQPSEDLNGKEAAERVYGTDKKQSGEETDFEPDDELPFS